MGRVGWVGRGVRVGGGRKNREMTKVIIYLVYPKQNISVYFSAFLPGRHVTWEQLPCEAEFSHFLVSNLIEMSKLLGWLCQTEGEKKSRINQSIWNCICRKDVRKQQVGAKLCLPRLLLATAGPSPGLLAAPDKGASQSLPEQSPSRVLAPASTLTISPLFFTTRLSAGLPVANHRVRPWVSRLQLCKFP